MMGLIADSLCFAGLVAIAAGLFLVHPALAWIFGGLAAMAAGLLLERRR